MSKQEDDAGRSPLPKRRGPTAEQLRELAAQDRWLKEHINWQGLRRFAYSHEDDAVICDEAVQDVYHRMVGWSVEDLEGLRHPKAYTRQAVLNRINDLRAAIASSLPDDYESVPDNTPPPEEQLERREQAIELLAELPQSWREPLVYIRVYGFTIEETALELNLTHDSAKKRGANALKYLKIICGVLPQDSLVRRVKKLLQREGRGHE